MSEEKKRVPTWNEIHDTEAAIRVFDGAAAMAAKTLSMFDDERCIGEEIDSTIRENVSIARTLRAWCRDARAARESEDLERKKAGLA